MELINKCKSKCWCNFCAKGINKDEKYLDIRRSAWKGNVRINICLVCLEKFYKDNKKALKEIKIRRASENI